MGILRDGIIVNDVGSTVARVNEWQSITLFDTIDVERTDTIIVQVGNAGDASVQGTARFDAFTLEKISSLNP